MGKAAGVLDSIDLDTRSGEAKGRKGATGPRMTKQRPRTTGEAARPPRRALATSIPCNPNPSPLQAVEI